MSDTDNQSKKPPAGTIGWIDMTTENATDVSMFYDAVVGWKSDAVPVGDYEDFVVQPAGDGDAVAGICHKRGINSDAPAGWMLYIHVDDLGKSLETCTRLGGKQIGEIRDMGSYGRICAIEDPGSARCVLIESP